MSKTITIEQAWQIEADLNALAASIQENLGEIRVCETRYQQTVQELAGLLSGPSTGTKAASEAPPESPTSAVTLPLARV
ncbi:MAG TPA: hypothetical protein DCP28_39050, partial [Cytophagales bacterium]|nr:hypothetical protein [Cytophagales bacterium]